ncbi:PTS sugar transporter subunit IIA [Pengzhenrongella sp.]|jgi:PTS system ascorbate-specific IIA component|uniref:PTS sugar transporter subunit IIA n=1 Tax=Pengzhenrongella sp. TaxID=2888820 RepID=UPI002F93CB1F
MATTSLAEQLGDTGIVVGAEAENWQEAITLAGDALVRSGITTDDYTLEMIDAVTRLGPYIVIAPGIALAHSRPSPAVLTTGISWVQLAEPVAFGNPKNDPVSLVIGLAASDHDGHLAIMAALAAVLMDRPAMARLRAATSSDEVRDLLR